MTGHERMTARERLAARQAGLVRALLAGAEPPPGFDPRRVRIEAAALRAKRRRVTERLRPDLADALGERFAPLFDAWAAANLRADGTTARADAAAFHGWLRSHGHLPSAGRPRWLCRRRRKPQ